MVGEAADGADAVAVCRERRPDVVLMDLRMPRVDGVTATAQLKKDPAPPLVLALTTFNDDQLMIDALTSGADGFLLKQLTPRELMSAIRAVNGGASVVNTELSRRILTRISGGDAASTAFPDAANRLHLLSEREREVLGQVGLGLDNAEIAERLHMSVSTVKTYVSRGLTKLRLDNRVQAALLANQLRLTTTDHTGRPRGT
ncbi:DNA-binding response regulator, NarL/FixJ family, contains REC and HTH domains [Amycolatopsis arida]|uniref:DNA-binding response regulator, NarL/FixJ family, contains REC and HTH domains n=1 Tax=Amycolatopsis arida TaxID=587909 RepID=A0A1I5SWL1_9PSEU|nr:DNA-binding NarL/FixJ family response regulator [Amycolatopsis arida]SFP75130.1 DNA-binding response regulator, NarL/FixJ family, contains REC and HTH domains [Amycolatopsis arida]